MEVEIGIRDVARAVTFESKQSSEEISATIAQALASSEHALVNLEDTKGRHIIIPAAAIGYVMVGSDTSHPVGFGTL